MATSAPKTAPKLVAKATTPEGDEGAPVVKKKSGKKAMLIAIIVVVVLGMVGGAAYFSIGGSDPNAAAATDADADADPDAPSAEEIKAKAEPVKPPRFLVIEPFTVNLQSEGAGDQFLQISFSLQLADDKQEEMIKLYMPQARSRLLLLLSGKKASEISTIKGKEKLAEELVAQLKVPFVPQGTPLGISNVFFTSFVIQ